MSSSRPFDYRDVSMMLFYLCLLLAAVGFSIYLFVAPEPAILKELDAWFNEHQPYVAVIGIMLMVGGFIWGMTSFQTETHEKLDALDKKLDSIRKDLAEMKRDS